MSNKMYDNITGRSPIATDDLGYIGTGQKASQIISSGTTNYNELTNKPSINSVELSGNKTSSDLGLQPELNEAQTNAANSGITAALTEQITTNQNNISSVKEKTDKIYVQETEPTVNITVNDTWIGGQNIIQKYVKTANLSPELSDFSDGFISGTGGVEAASVDKKEKLSDYIAIEANTAYIFSAQPDNFPTGATAEDTAWKGVAFYTENKSFISRSATQGTGEYAVTSPNNAAYARLMLRTYGATPHTMFNVGANALPYTPQYKWIDTNNDYKSNNVKGINHRGYNTVAPENTMPAYILSKKMGFEYVETDISFTSDGVAVLLHDSSIDRTSDGTGNISDMTYAQVSQYDFGSWKSAEYTGTKIPTFDEFIKFCRNVGLKVYAELKSTPTQTQVDTVCNIVKKYNMENEVSWISFDSTALEKVLTDIPTARVGFLVSTASSAAISTTSGLKTSDNSVFLDCSSITDTIISEAITAAVPVEIWTVNSAAKITAANGYITGFTSDSLNASTVVADISMY